MSPPAFPTRREPLLDLTASISSRGRQSTGALMSRSRALGPGRLLNDVGMPPQRLRIAPGTAWTRILVVVFCFCTEDDTPQSTVAARTCHRSQGGTSLALSSEIFLPKRAAIAWTENRTSAPRPGCPACAERYTRCRTTRRQSLKRNIPHLWLRNPQNPPWTTTRSAAGRPGSPTAKTASPTHSCLAIANGSKTRCEGGSETEWFV
jgi:hypothetical protein